MTPDADPTHPMPDAPPPSGPGAGRGPATAADATAAEATDADGAAGPTAGSDPPGIRDQIGAVIAAVKRLVGAHIALAKAEASEIVGEVGRMAALGGVAFGLVFLAALLIPIGLLLFLGEWIFGSIGWGVLLGPLLLIDLAVVAVLVAVGVSGGRLGRSLLLAGLLGIVVGVVLGLDLTNRGWTIVGDAVLPTVDEGIRPLAIAVAALGIIGAVLGLIGGLRSGGSAVGGLIMGAIGGILLGVLTAVALGPRVGAAFGVLTALIAWPALMGLDVSRAGIDTDALKARFWPDQTIDTTKETIEWVRQRTPLGRKS